MTSFLIGEVLKPEITQVQTKNGLTRRFVMGLLSGRTSTTFSVWEGDNLFKDVATLEHGDVVCAIVGDGLDNTGKLRHYLNGIALCDEGFRDSLNALFDKE